MRVPSLVRLIFQAVLLARVEYGSDVRRQPLSVSICLLEYGGAQEGAVDIVNAEFFDEENLLIIYRNEGEGAVNNILRDMNPNVIESKRISQHRNSHVRRFGVSRTGV